MPFAPPRLVEDVKDCYFYHSMDIPGVGQVSGEWDLRRGIDKYLGSCDFRQKRVLDVGTASGFLTFHVEAAGAEAISFDLSEDWSWDVVPHADAITDDIVAARRRHMRRINNGYWLAHRAFKSKAMVAYGTTYDIPSTIGPVDIAIYGSILLHLRDPFRALESVAKLARDAIIVADVAPRCPLSHFTKRPTFLPRRGVTEDPYTWWSLPPRLIGEFLAILGFPHATITWHRQHFLGRKKWLYTIVGRRNRSR